MAYGRAARCSVDMFCAAFLRRIWLGTVIFAAGLRMSWRSMRHGVRRSASLPVQRRGLSPQGALIGARAHYALRKLRHPCPALMLMPVRRSAPLPVHRCGITAAVVLIGAQANYAPRILHRAYPALTLTSFQRQRSSAGSAARQVASGALISARTTAVPNATCPGTLFPA